MVKGITPAEINRCLCVGSGTGGSKERIYRQFQKKLSAQENIDFLKKEYGVGGRYPAYTSPNPNDELEINFGGKGIKINRIHSQEEKVILSWTKVEKRIKALIFTGIYKERL